MIDNILVITPAVVGIVGIFGWSHRALKTKIDHIEQEILKKTNLDAVRVLISDKLAPHKVAYSAIKQDISELRQQYMQMDQKLDRLIYLISKLDGNHD